VRGLAILLTVLGGVLPVAALIWAWLATRRPLTMLDDDLSSIYAISEAHPDANEGTPLMYAVRRPTATNVTVLYTKEEVQRAILSSALKDLKGPALLAGAGALAGMAGSPIPFFWL
jgi:hypothetical protein